MLSAWCFFQVDYAGFQSPVLEFDKTALKTLIFIKKLIFAFLNPKNPKMKEKSSETPLNFRPLQCTYLGKNSFNITRA